MKIDVALILLIAINQIRCEKYDVGKGKPVNLTRNGKGDENINDANYIYDTNLNTFLRATSINDISVFLQVDLQASYNVTKIIVYASNDASCSSYTGQFLIYVRSTNSTSYDLNGITNYGLFNSTELSGVSFISTGSGYNFTKSEGMAGRYVTLKKQLSQRTIDLCIAELIIISEASYYGPIDLTNPTQNNVYNNDIQSYGANNAIDKNPTTCSYTSQNNVSIRNIAGWWMVDLESSYRIYSVAINNNELRNNGGLATFNIYVQESTSSPQQLCHSVVEPIEQMNLNKNFLCASDVSGRYVNITKTGRDRVDNLLLCEVSVYAKNMADKVQLLNMPTITTTSPPTLPALLSSSSSLTPLPLTTVVTRQTVLPNSNTSQPSAPFIVTRENSLQNIAAIALGCVVGIMALVIALLLALVIYQRHKIIILSKQEKASSNHELSVSEAAYSSINTNLENDSKMEHPYDQLTITNKNRINEEQLADAPYSSINPNYDNTLD